jgi:hypothetical protein
MSYSGGMADTITIRTDEETEYALDVLTFDGSSRSAAIRQAALEAARRRERAAEMRRAVLRMDLGQPDGVNVAEELGPRPHPRAVMIYLDSAAVVKLAHASPNQRRCAGGWASGPRPDGSVRYSLKSKRSGRWPGMPGAVSRLPAVLDQIDLIDLDPRIRILAQAVEPATVRSLADHRGTSAYGLTMAYRRSSQAQ